MSAFWNKETDKVTDKADKAKDTTEPKLPIFGLTGVKNIIAVASGKGGVGKSTVATNLAIGLKNLGWKVGLLDADIYGPSQPGMLGSDSAEARTTEKGQLIPNEVFGVKFVSMGLLMPEDGPVVWRAPMAMKMIQQFLAHVQWDELDYLIVDLPPGTGDVQLTIAQGASLTGAIIVSTPQDVALKIAKKGLKMFQQVRVPILGIVENMSGFVCSHCNQETEIFKKGGAEAMATELGVPFLGKIPLDTEIMESADSGVPVLEKNKSSPAAKAYKELSSRIDADVQMLSAAVRMDQPRNMSLVAPGLTGGVSTLRIEWPDGHVGAHKPYRLRLNCACANCIDENTGNKILDPKKVPLDIQILSFDKVGRYAITAKFSDGHSTGIYTFERLRRICECEKCVAKLGAQAEAFTV